MKKTILLLLFVLSATSVFSQGMFNLFGKTDDFFKLMGEEKFPEAYAYFDPQFQAKVPQDKLHELWTTLGGKLGKLESISITSSKTQGELYVFTVEAKFLMDTQNFTLAFNKTEKIVGLFLQPKATSTEYIRPMYADTTLYSEKEIYIKADAKHSLVGILTVPKKATNYPLVVMVHGSGPGDMDGSVGPNRPLRDFAAGLGAKGIASIRYVKRTTLYANEFIGAITVKEEVLDDALAAVAMARTLPGVDKKKIYVLGHSLGGMLAPRIATLAPDLNGLILIAAPARKLSDLVAEQTQYMYGSSVDTSEAGKKALAEMNSDIERSRLTSLPATMKADSAIMGLPASYWIDLNKYDQVETIKKLNKQRVFVAQGAFDFQVSMKDFELWSAALSGRDNVELKSYVDLNHLMSSQVEKGTLQQYQKPGNVSSILMDDLTSWINLK
ncbi:MAG: alpha/beta fold hydrolase [Pedobacter sp.]|nr:MAG: alpha/beta fold hydrolase [Pedobacter sp.]